MSKYSVSTIFKGVDKVSKPLGKMRQSVSNFTSSAENGLRKVDAAMSGISGSIFGATKKLATGIAGIGTSAIVASGLINKQQAEIESLTSAVNANIKTVEAVSSAISASGLNAENVIDLYEEMNNKLGESKGLEEITAVTESLQILGLSFEDIKKLAPEEQFKAITNAALKMEDATKAQAAADILMGGEANKIIGILRQQGKTMDDIIGNYETLSFRTEKSRQGAADMAKAQRETTKIFASLSKELAGLVGVHLTPLIEKFNEFIIANKVIIGQSIDKFFENVAGSVGDFSLMLDTAIGWVKQIALDFDAMIESAKKIGKLIAIFAGVAVAIKALIGLLTAINLIMAANPIVLGALAIAAAVTGIYLAWEPLKTFFTDLFSGIQDRFDSFIGGISSGVSGIKDFFGFGDSDTQVTTNATVSPQERAITQYTERRDSMDLYIKPEKGMSAYTYGASNNSRLNLINTAD